MLKRVPLSPALKRLASYIDSDNKERIVTLLNRTLKYAEETKNYFLMARVYARLILAYYWSIDRQVSKDSQLDELDKHFKALRRILECWHLMELYQDKAEDEVEIETSDGRRYYQDLYIDKVFESLSLGGVFNRAW